jgi:hypothetical protein
MSTPTPTASPIRFATAWHKFNLNGMRSPGTIPRGGVRGFKRETGWDIKKGKGTQGATLTLKTVPPVEGMITMQLATNQDFADWDQFVAQVLSLSPDKQKVTGLFVYYPAFASIGLTSVVVKDYSPPEHIGKGMYHASVQLIEWNQPPPVSIAKTVSTGSTTLPEIQIKGQNPEIAALEAQLAILNRANRP